VGASELSYWASLLSVPVDNNTSPWFCPPFWICQACMALVTSAVLKPLLLGAIVAIVSAW
jgi:hypothetical protein